VLDVDRKPQLGGRATRSDLPSERRGCGMVDGGGGSDSVSFKRGVYREPCVAEGEIAGNGESRSSLVLTFWVSKRMRSKNSDMKGKMWYEGRTRKHAQKPADGGSVRLPTRKRVREESTRIKKDH